VIANPEVEANGTFATATPLSATGAGQGSVGVAGDVDSWSFSATVNSTIRVELHATRRDQATWAAGPNLPRLTLFDVDGTTRLLDHDPTAETWVHGGADLDFPAFHVPATGTYFLRVAQDNPANPAGLYVLRVLTVNVPTPFQEELEPAMVAGVNDAPGTAEPIVPGTVHGWHVDGESDYYSFTLAAPATVCFEVLAYRSGLSRADANLFDSRLTLYDAGLTMVQQIEDVATYDSVLCRTLLSAGTYFLEVDNAFNNGDGEYLLFFERIGAPLAATEVEANDTAGVANTINYDTTSRGTTSLLDPDFFRFFGQAGDAVTVQVFDVANMEGAVAAVGAALVAPDGVTVLASTTGPVGGASLQVVRTVLQATGNHYVRILGAAAITSYAFRIERPIGSQRETEANNTLATANSIPGTNFISGVLSAPGDQDHFSLGLDAGQLVVLHLYAGSPLHGDWTADDYDRFGSPLLPRLTLFDPGNAQVAQSTRTPVGGVASAQSITNGLASATLTYVANAGGTHTLQVIDEAAGGGATFWYVIERR
jgi:hypothetical protein